MTDDTKPEPKPVDKLAEWNRRSWEEGKTGIDVTVTIKRGDLGRVTDATLAMYWHIAQANPAPHGDRAAGELVQAIGFEIIRRWLAAAPPELYTHQPRNHYWLNLGRFAKWNGESWEATPETLADAIVSAGLAPEDVTEALAKKVGKDSA